MISSAGCVIDIKELTKWCFAAFLWHALAVLARVDYIHFSSGQ